MSKTTDEVLVHYGVKGMQWGVRRSKVERMASKDAKEFARAKQFYGEGAGTRRKLIKAKVESNRTRVKGYSNAFDKALSKQDLGKASDKAVRDRKRKDRSKATKQTAGAVARRATGEFGTKAAFVALTASGVAYLKSPQGQSLMRKVQGKVSNIKDSRAHKIGADYLEDYFKRNG